MSVVFLVTPLVIAGWPTFCAAAATAAASLGFKVLKGLEQEELNEIERKAAMEKRAREAEGTVELEMKDSNVLTEQVRADDEMILGKGEIQVRIYKDARGKCAIHVMGKGKSKQELKKEGTELLNKITQQYAYQKVTQELKSRGFSITDEAVTEDGKIKIRLRRFQ
jgi:hypothetical protein